MEYHPQTIRTPPLSVQLLSTVGTTTWSHRIQFDRQSTGPVNTASFGDTDHIVWLFNAACVIADVRVPYPTVSCPSCTQNAFTPTVLLFSLRRLFDWCTNLLWIMGCECKLPQFHGSSARMNKRRKHNVNKQLYWQVCQTECGYSCLLVILAIPFIFQCP